MNNSVLIFANNFIPYTFSLGNAIRAITLADFLVRHGFDVTVLAEKGKDYGCFGYDQVLTKIGTHYVDINSAGLSDWLNGNLSLISHGLIPESRAKGFYHLFRTAKNLIERKDIRNVIVTTPPHNAQLVSLFLKSYFKERINLIVDYRDSWFTNDFYRKKGKISRHFSEKKEKKILTNLDHFTYISNPIFKHIERQYQIQDFGKKSHLIMNGYNKTPKVKAREENPSGPIKIGYFGALEDSKNSFRNISTIVEALRNNPSLQQKVEFYFYGDIVLNHTPLNEVHNIHIKRSVSHDEALEIMSQMDFLLIIHSNPKTSEEVITGKFFEYVSVKKPILNITPPVMEANRLVAEYGIGKTIDIRSSESVAKGLEQLERLKNCYDGIDITSFSRDQQYERFLPLLS